MNKKWMTGVVVLAVSASLAIAAPGAGNGFGRHRGRGLMSEKLAQKLNLTDAQKQQIRDLNKASRQENKAFFLSVRQTMQEYRAARQANDTARINALQPTVDSQRAQMKQIHEAQEQKLISILTPDQRTQYEAFKAERAQRWQKRSQQ